MAVPVKVKYKGVNLSSFDRNKSVNNLLLGAHPRNESSHLNAKLVAEEGTVPLSARQCRARWNDKAHTFTTICYGL